MRWVCIQRLFVAIICFEMVLAGPSYQFLDLSWVGQALDLFRGPFLMKIWHYNLRIPLILALQLSSRKFAPLFICPSWHAKLFLTTSEVSHLIQQEGST